jgi:predicted GNAT superfamily acetyltransferase
MCCPGCSTCYHPVLITGSIILGKLIGEHLSGVIYSGGIKRMMKTPWTIKIIDHIDEMHQVEHLQRLVWNENEIDIVPAHLINSASHNGGLLIGAYMDSDLVGFVFGFPGVYPTPDGPRVKHYSSMLGVRPDVSGQGIGFALKRAQWQMVRHQGIDRITWTFDPLLSRNAWLNITRLGAVCNIFLRNFYGKMDDQLNRGLPTDRFDVDWWVNSNRVNHRLSRRRRKNLDLYHFLSGGAPILNPAELDPSGYPHPADGEEFSFGKDLPILLVEIPADFQVLKANNLELALEWRLHSRTLFEELFRAGYIVTDFIRTDAHPYRSYYVLCHGESTL